jgi:hypothetical protein
MSSLNLQIDPYSSRDRKREQADTLFRALLAAHPDLDAKTAQSVFDSINQTGQLPGNLPTGKLQLKPAEGPSLPNQPPPQAEVPQTLGDLSFRPDKKKLRFIGFDQKAGTMKPLTLPPDVQSMLDSPDTDAKVLNFGNKKEDPTGSAVFYDRKTGRTIRREPSKTDHFIPIGENGRGGAGANDRDTLVLKAQIKDSLDQLDEYNRWTRENPNEEPPAEMRTRAVQAAQFLELPVDQKSTGGIKLPSWMGGIQLREPTLKEYPRFLPGKTAGQQERKSGRSSSVGLQPGAVVDGYRFKGGNPKDRKNWEAAEQ